MTLPGVEKIALGNNQFGVKHRILRAVGAHLGKQRWGEHVTESASPR